MIGAEYTFNVKFSVLEVYPTTPQLQDIVGVYAPDQIDIYSMHIDDFNSQQPNLNAYDMIIFSCRPLMEEKNISDTMAQK